MRVKLRVSIRVRVLGFRFYVLGSRPVKKTDDKTRHDKRQQDKARQDKQQKRTMTQDKTRLNTLRTRIASPTTSGPIPSPDKTAIFQVGTLKTDMAGDRS